MQKYFFLGVLLTCSTIMFSSSKNKENVIPILSQSIPSNQSNCSSRSSQMAQDQLKEFNKKAFLKNYFEKNDLYQNENPSLSKIGKHLDKVKEYRELTSPNQNK